jgi:hypothetical protein
MRAWHFSAIYKPSGLLGVCLCIAVVGSMILGTAVSDAAATGSPPEIRAFRADPTTLKDGDSALYSFEVWNATALQISEAGDVIRMIRSAPSSFLKGTARGRTTYQIRTGGSSSFDVVLLASSPGGRLERKLTIKFATTLPVSSTSTVPGSDNGTTARTPKWGPQFTSTLPADQSPASTLPTVNWPPQFAKCSSDCNYCLRPEDAAARGFTQKCSDQPCYYSPDNQQKWYCYSKPATIWCCKDGKVVEMTKDQCAQTGGSGYATEAEATRACQQVVGWYCSGGNVYQGTQQQAAQAGVAWYATQAEAAKVCNPAGWCCRGGQIAQTDKTQCAQAGGNWFTTQGEALRACQQMMIGWFCMGGNVYQGTQQQAAQAGATWYSTQAEAARACQTTYWCCSNGQVYQTTTYTSGCYKTQTEAQQACSACWCCSAGKVYQTTPAACARSGGTCYSSQSQAAAGCRVILK